MAKLLAAKGADLNATNDAGVRRSSLLAFVSLDLLEHTAAYRSDAGRRRACGVSAGAEGEGRRGERAALHAAVPGTWALLACSPAADLAPGGRPKLRACRIPAPGPRCRPLGRQHGGLHAADDGGGRGQAQRGAAAAGEGQGRRSLDRHQGPRGQARPPHCYQPRQVADPCFSPPFFFWRRNRLFLPGSGRLGRRAAVEQGIRSERHRRPRSPARRAEEARGGPEVRFTAPG